jgi:Uma2 family endonuclease
VRSQGGLDLGNRQQPIPDVAVVPGSPRDHARDHPTSALLVVEVSDTTIRYDRGFKAHLYARAGISDYWIVNLGDRQLEIHRNPGPDPDRASRFCYAEVTVIPADGQASPLARPEALIAVADLLP